MSRTTIDDLDMGYSRRRSSGAVVIGRGRWVMATIALFLAVLAYAAGQADRAKPLQEPDQTASNSKQIPH